MTGGSRRSMVSEKLGDHRREIHLSTQEQHRRRRSTTSASLLRTAEAPPTLILRAKRNRSPARLPLVQRLMKHTTTLAPLLLHFVGVLLVQVEKSLIQTGFVEQVLIQTDSPSFFAKQRRTPSVNFFKFLEGVFLFPSLFVIRILPIPRYYRGHSQLDRIDYLQGPLRKVSRQRRLTSSFLLPQA